MSDKRFRDDDGKLDLGKIERYEDSSYKIVLLLKYIEEQQATIRKLQDLCGESDSENAKLRIENKRLCDEIKLLKPTNVEQYEQIVQLQKENEQLRQTNEKLEQECRQHLATNLRLLEQLNDFEEKISDKKLFKQKVTCDYKGDYVR